MLATGLPAGVWATRDHCKSPSFTIGTLCVVSTRLTRVSSSRGLFAFASTTLILSLFNVRARGISTPNAVVGMALGVGGLSQLLAGMWEFACGNTFGATAFTMYGGFWLSYASILIPGSGILAAYSGNEQLTDALGIYLTTWGLLTFILLVAASRRNMGLIALFAFLTITFFLLAGGEYTGRLNVTKAGGYFGIITALIAFYVGLAELLTREDSWFTLPLGQIPKRLD
ncbi:FUN34 transmembrane protein [Cristinia sonorae]|uniref:FUN34 transmembrane protein n=1 Tax=Cristinia sonorae TaxID=1940300 RepID=A0A8K0UJ58_9AGAR|nr:FUN34 transmembrane protein [Cristinia sonorae]